MRQGEKAKPQVLLLAVVTHSSMLKTKVGSKLKKLPK